MSRAYHPRQEYASPSEKQMNPVFLVRQIDMYGNERDIKMCASEDEAEITIRQLNEALPKGVLLWFYKKRIDHQ